MYQQNRVKWILILALIASISFAKSELGLMDILEGLDLIPDETTFQRQTYSTLGEVLTCAEAAKNLIKNFNVGSLFYVLVNGWYLGQWGDYSSCLADTTNGQYVLVTMNGKYTGEATFTRGSQGKFRPFATLVGMCIPKQCKKADLKQHYDSHFIEMASNVNWTDVSVDYYFASENDTQYYNQSSAGTTAILVLLGFVVILGVIGTIFELTSLGDQKGLDYKRLQPAARFLTVKQYEPILMQRKNLCGRITLMFSLLRNMMRFSMPSRAYQEARNFGVINEMTKHLSVFNGLKGLGILYVIYGHTYFFSWYGVYDNPSQIDTFKSQLFFTFITGAFFVAPVMIFTCGFLSTFSLMYAPIDDTSAKLTIKKFVFFILRRYFRLMPYNLFILGFGMFLMPKIGYGPIWNTYEQVMSSCDSNWWTNLLFINNFYPTNFDEKCMPWTWFLAVYMQLTLVLPILLSVYQFLPLIVSVITYTVLFIGFFGLNMGLIAGKDIGAIPAFNDQFYAELFMRPYYHFNSYLLGVVCCLLYLKFLKERSNPLANTRSSRLFNFVRSNAIVRYLMYVLSLFLMLITLMGQHSYLKDPSSWSTFVKSLYGAFAYPTFAFGVSLFIVPALLGKAEFIRFFFGGDVWTFFANFAYPLFLFHPLMCLYYYLSMTNTLHVDQQMMFYNFCGNLVFSFVFSLIFGVLVDRPVCAIFNYKHDLKLAHYSKDFNIENYRVGQMNSDSMMSGSQGRNRTDRMFVEDNSMSKKLIDDTSPDARKEEE